jgi:hypothetical protein
VSLIATNLLVLYAVVHGTMEEEAVYKNAFCFISSFAVPKKFGIVLAIDVRGGFYDNGDFTR